MCSCIYTIWISVTPLTSATSQTILTLWYAHSMSRLAKYQFQHVCDSEPGCKVRDVQDHPPSQPRTGVPKSFEVKWHLQNTMKQPRVAHYTHKVVIEEVRIVENTMILFKFLRLKTLFKSAGTCKVRVIPCVTVQRWSTRNAVWFQDHSHGDSRKCRSPHTTTRP